MYERLVTGESCLSSYYSAACLRGASPVRGGCEALGGLPGGECVPRAGASHNNSIGQGEQWALCHVRAAEPGAATRDL